MKYWKDIKTKEEAFHKIITGGDRSEVEFTRDNEDDLNVLTNLTNFKPDDVIVDFGCGVGRLMKPLSSKVKKIYGLDISDKMIEYGIEYCKGIKNIEFMQLASYKFPKFKDKINKIYSVLAIQHIKKKRFYLILKEMYKVLPIGGEVILQFPRFEAQLKEVIECYWFRKGVQKDVPTPIMEFYTSIELEHLAKLAGFKHGQVRSEIKRTDRLWLIATKE